MRWVIPGSYSGARLDTISAADTPIVESWWYQIPGSKWQILEVIPDTGYRTQIWQIPKVIPDTGYSGSMYVHMIPDSAVPDTAPKVWQIRIPDTQHQYPTDSIGRQSTFEYFVHINFIPVKPMFFLWVSYALCIGSIQWQVSSSLHLQGGFDLP
jgi:hypothetical protein